MKACGHNMKLPGAHSRGHTYLVSAHPLPSPPSPPRHRRRPGAGRYPWARSTGWFVCPPRPSSSVGGPCPVYCLLACRWLASAVLLFVARCLLCGWISLCVLCFVFVFCLSLSMRVGCLAAEERMSGGSARARVDSNYPMAIHSLTHIML